MSLIVVVGTRPEIIKMAPIIKKLEKEGLEYLFVHTGQHYDYEMSQIFIKQLELPNPTVSFELQSNNPVAQIGEIMIKFEEFIKNPKKYKLSLIQGDTNTMLAAGLTAIKFGWKLGHIEAGLRSYDWRMPEEHNRRMIDHVSNYLFAPTEISKKNLILENVWGEIYVTGNTIIDALDLYFNKVKELEDKILEKLKFEEFALVTFHRAENVDNPQTLRDFIKIIRESPIPIIYPIHPHTKKKLLEFGLWERLRNITHLQILPPQGYFEFLTLMKTCRIILSDSGGIQEEATYPKIRKHVLVLRTSTERPEAVIHGFAKIVGTNPIVVLTELEKTLSEDKKPPKTSPFGDGKASERIFKVIVQSIE